MRLKIAEIRDRFGMTQQELADKVNIARPTLTLIENRKRRLTVDMQKKIADALGVLPCELIDYDGPEPEEIDLIVSAFIKLRPDQRKALVDMARIVCSEK